MIDTHAHLNFEVFDIDRQEVIERCFTNGIKAMIIPGAKLDSSQSAVVLADQYGKIFAAVGLHPIYVEDEEFNITNYRDLAKQKKVVAIGEVGLDYFYRSDAEFKNKQQKIFEQFIDLAQELNLPMILHCRGSKENPEEAYLEMLEILQNKRYYNGVIHCFTSTPEIAQKFLDLGFYIGFTGVVTFAKNLVSTVKAIPLDRILLETDCPFMSPEPKRGERCEPWYIKFTAQKIAEIKEIEVVKIINLAQENSQRVFNLK